MNRNKYFTLKLVIGLFIIPLFLTCSAEFDNPYDPFSSSYKIFTVTYNGNGNTSGTVPGSETHVPGTTISLSGNTGYLMKINVSDASYRFTGWNTQADGNGTDYMAGEEYTINNSNVILYARWETYAIRDTGPAGGLVFYDKGTYSDGWRYLEAAPMDISGTLLWSSVTIDLATLLTVGSGQANTTLILNQSSTAPAAMECNDLEIVNNSITYNDWFLPSSDEINLMYTNLKVYNVGSFNTTGVSYWSSSDCGDNCAVSQLFNDNMQPYWAKSELLYVRAARAF